MKRFNKKKLRIEVCCEPKPGIPFGPLLVETASSPRAVLICVPDIDQLLTQPADEVDGRILSALGEIVQAFPGRMLRTAYWVPAGLPWPKTRRFLEHHGFEWTVPEPMPAWWRIVSQGLTSGSMGGRSERTS
jgi:hypothetical protein